MRKHLAQFYNTIDTHKISVTFILVSVCVTYIVYSLSQYEGFGLEIKLFRDILFPLSQIIGSYVLGIIIRVLFVQVNASKWPNEIKTFIMLIPFLYLIQMFVALIISVVMIRSLDTLLDFRNHIDSHYASILSSPGIIVLASGISGRFFMNKMK